MFQTVQDQEVKNRSLHYNLAINNVYLCSRGSVYLFSSRTLFIFRVDTVGVKIV